jgi:triosephosphate isomerase
VTLLAANWKMYKGPRETREFCEAFTAPEGVEAVLCPPFASLPAAVESGQTVFAQNVHWASEGAYTGEVSAPMLAELGVAGAIVGHSERRQYFGEDDELVNRKARAVLEAGMRPIVCVGEVLSEREAGRTAEVVQGQVRGSLAGLSGDQVAGLVVAYEPVWAIGTGEVATPDDAQEAAAAIRSRVSEFHDAETAASVRILYGGSVKPGNVAPIMAQPDVDGTLVGGASLDAGQFAQICRYRELAA